MYIDHIHSCNMTNIFDRKKNKVASGGLEGLIPGMYRRAFCV